MTDVPTNDILDFDKKKKKKKAIISDLKPAEREPQVEKITPKKEIASNDKLELDEESSDLNLEGKKKKKTKKVIIAEEVDKLAEELNAELEFGAKKRKKPVLLESDIILEDKLSLQIPQVADAKDPSETGVYTYEWLLQRVFSEIRTRNPELISDRKRRVVMLPPQLARVGSKKTSFVNFSAIASILKRDPAHLSSYLLTELGTTGSVDANGALLIRGRYQSKHIEPVLKSYCRNYVLCGTCQSPETELSKDSRLLFMTCRRCSSRISVKTVQGGFHAVTSKRATIRAKAQ